MMRSRTPSQGGGSQNYEMERKYSVPSNPESRTFSGTASEDLHAWSIYRQNLNSDFTDSALGSSDKSPLPYGNFQLRDTTVQSILSHPRYGPKSALGSNMYTYLKFGLPRVFPPNHNGSNRSGTPQHPQQQQQQQQQHFSRNASSSTRPYGRTLKSGNRTIRDGSSGYDSSDNETTNQYKQNRKYRSDPDFRMHQHQQQQQQQNCTLSHQGGSPGIPLAAMQQSGLRPQNQWNRNKSISETDLISADFNKNYNVRHSHMRDPRRNSVAEFRQQQQQQQHSHHHHHHHHPHSHHLHQDTLFRENLMQPKPESHLSVDTARRGHPGRMEFLNSDEPSAAAFIYPHLQVCGIGVWPRTNCLKSKHHLLLSEISFEVRGGEILAIMATSEDEGTAILDIVAGLKSPIIGDIIINGQNIKSNDLKQRVAYVQNDLNLCKDMTVQQILRFCYDLRKPTEKMGYFKIDPIDRINALIEDLGLEQVRSTKIASMTTSEKRRLNVACHLLLDTDIVVLDQPTKGMDIFDTFFLIEYLRQWANGNNTSTNGTVESTLGRIVILTLHPPTYEIFTMLSRILLISAGRTMFSGRRSDMLPYFALVEYPCPSFKNPSDYYLDLVTLDDLSAEAMLESSQRIEQLADIFRQKQEPMSDPGPPSTLPLTIRNSNCFTKGFVLLTKSMIYTQPNTFIKWLILIIISASLSLISGAIFWDIPNTDPYLKLNDRFGYHYCMMTLLPWSILLLLTVTEVRRNKSQVERDIRDGLYGRFTYIITKSIITIFPSLFIWLIYLVPSYSMTGLYMQNFNNYEGFYIYIGIMLLYLICIEKFIVIFIYLLPWSNCFATVLSTILLSIFFIISGYLIHFNDLPNYFEWLEFINPTLWTMSYLLNRELSTEAISSSFPTMLCRNKQVQHQDIIVQLPCPPPNGTQILLNYNYHTNMMESYYYHSNLFIVLILYFIIISIIACVIFTINCFGRSKQQKNYNDNKR